MSEINEQPFSSPEEKDHNYSDDPKFSSEEEVKVKTIEDELNTADVSIDDKSYPLGEVPQAFLLDPEGTLALNSDLLNQGDDNLQSMLDEVEFLVDEEVHQIQKLQKTIDLWEEKIEKNKAHIIKDLERIKTNARDIECNKKNRDYWWCRKEQVDLDYKNTETSGREEDWAWLIKKYGLKNPDGMEIDHKHPCVEELCNGGCKNLSGNYQSSGAKYEHQIKEKERENTRLIKESSRYRDTNDTLHRYIHTAYENKIEPLQEGVVLLKELSSKLKAFAVRPNEATYGQMREWAELYLDEFLRDHPNVNQAIVSNYRRIASIPLPAENY